MSNPAIIYYRKNFIIILLPDEHAYDKITDIKAFYNLTITDSNRYFKTNFNNSNINNNEIKLLNIKLSICKEI